MARRRDTSQLRDWDRHRLLFEIRSRGLTWARIGAMASPPIRGDGIRRVIDKPWRRAEAVVAAALNVGVDEIWPIRQAARHRRTRERIADDAAFAARLRTAMGGRRQGDVAAAIGVTKQAFSQYFRGVRPGADRAARLAELLGVSVAWLMTGDDQKVAA